ILTFLGEAAIVATSADWRAHAEAALVTPAQICTALIGSTRVDLKTLLEALHDYEAGIPFVLVADANTLPDELAPDLLSRITATLSGNLSYQPLLDALHKAKLFHEHYNRLRDVGGVRDYTMFHSLVGSSQAIEQVRHMMGQVANKEVSVLITGESGTGKEVVARNLHLNSSRADKPFVPINCGAIPRELLESELFGHEKGAFTGAVAARVGRFELANEGTLFLDEIGDMPLNMQVKLLRVLQERSFERVGGIKTIHVDVRILAATHKNLEHMIAHGEFREDLYYRLNVFPIDMPPLRERAEDVPLLLNELISEMEAGKRGSVRFNSAAIRSLRRYAWPGNVRELSNLVERMAILYPHGIVGVNDLPAKFREHEEGDEMPAGAAGVVPFGRKSQQGSDGDNSDSLLPMYGLDLKNYLSNLERDLIEKALKDCDGVVARAADRLNVRRTTLVEKMRKYNINRKADDEDAGDQSVSGV
ncbi:MAG: sigma-54-dependent Fis family transcriptional regulator, partial [Pseudohongiellaceae bacterium]